MTVPLFVELCAGTAALSLRLHARGARPPVSRMGAKTGYADCILRVLGLAPGARAAHYLWCEPDPGVRLLLEAYRDADLARAAAGIIRGWADEEPRALWERLRAEGPPRLPATGAEVARWVVRAAWSFEQGNIRTGFVGPGDRRQDTTATATALSRAPTLPATIHPDARTVDPREVARWAMLRAWSVTAGEDYFRGPGGVSSGEHERSALTIDGAAARFDAAPTLPATIHPDARTVDPREVARWARIITANRLIPVHHDGVKWRNSARNTPGAPTRGGLSFGGDDYCTPIAALADGFDAAPTLPATITPDARDVHPPALPPGTIVYVDPPYVGTTGYASDLPRSEVVTLARRWHAAGARVCISEAEPIPELTADGWHAVRIDGERRGSKRTFSRQQAEWLTLSDPPAWRPSVQAGLFG